MKGPGVPYHFTDGYLSEVKKPSDLPTGKCYVIQIFEDHSVYHEGDERSRTCPGHGYPAHTEHSQVVHQFATADTEVWRSKIQQLYQEDKNRTDVAAFAMEKWDVKVRVEVEVG